MEGRNFGPGPNVGGPRGGQKPSPVGVTEGGDKNNVGEGLHESGSVPTNVEMDSDYEKPYEYESEAFNSPISSEDEGKTAFDPFDEDSEYGEVEFKVGQLFPTIELFKKALKNYFVYERKDVLYIKNEKHRLKAACAAEGYPWLIFTSWNSATRYFQVETLFDEHTCARDYGSNMADRQWVASKLIKKLLIQPNMKPRHAMEHMIEEYNVQLNPGMIARALKVAREVVIGNSREQYGKGLELAIKEVMPNTHHKNCVHIWKNFIKHFKDQQTKQLVWECARCTTFQEFNTAMEKMKKVNMGAWEYLQRFEPAVWTKAYFSHGPKVDNITKNMCELWNAKIVEYREKLILTICEDLQCYLMRKMATHKRKLEAYSGQLTPVQQKKLNEFVKPRANKWRAIWAGDNDRVLFEVHRGNHKQLTGNSNSYVNSAIYCLGYYFLTKILYSASRMLCRHAVVTMYKIGLKPEEFVHKWLTMESIRATYKHCIQPVNSEEYWIPTTAPPCDPPSIKRPAHCPKMKRKVNSIEKEMHTNKERKSFEVTCSKCGQTGHYYRT
ncbi:uncharacterized protein LOC107610493 [Arachis ipaensis]|uniref:uncharacterized protein LOC107610493 n=1 Tax=Arachis ipaensis TaxID=130454 RepID=UPI0007AFCCC1|nr:uncharacterized protein LOC107610493 [Arachis ipaensis]